MRAVLLVARARLARSGLSLIVVGVLLGVGFGLSLASFTAARQTASAYSRILAASDAPDAAVHHGLPPDESELSLGTIDFVLDQRVYAGFLGRADGFEPVLTRSLLAPTADRFPIELPVMQAGRLPDPSAPDEVFIDTEVADASGAQVGQRVDFALYTVGGKNVTEESVTIVGIGRVPAEAVVDETSVTSVWVFTRAFYEAHRDLVAYSVSSVDLAPGTNARRDLAPAVSALGHELQADREQERARVSDALRPTVIVLVGLALLAFAASAVAIGQLMQRERERWASETTTLLASGMTRAHVRRVQFVTAGFVAVVATVVATSIHVLASPIAPIGALHDLDPDQGFVVDWTIAAAGVLFIVGTIAVFALVFSRQPRRAARVQAAHPAPFAAAINRPAALAGLTLAFRADQGRSRIWRSVIATTAATALFALGAALVSSASALSSTSSRYGFDADLLALNQYGDQPEAALEDAFGTADDVDAATAYTAVAFLVDGNAVPGLAATDLKADVGPTLLRGQAARADQEIVLGADTLDNIDADLGDLVPVQMSLPGAGETTGETVEMRIVGVATFPSVSQVGSDMPRLGIGAVVTRDAYRRLHGDAANGPEFTSVRVADGTEPEEIIARLPDGFRDAVGTETEWFTDTKPAELRQLDLAMPYVRGALAISFLIVLVVIAHALWTRVRTNRRDLAVLGAMGCTPRQIDEVTAWHAAPFAFAAIVVGLPVGVLLGHLAFTRFAHSLAVVEDAVTPLSVVAALVGTTLFAVAVAVLVSVVLRRRDGAPLRPSA